LRKKAFVNKEPFKVLVPLQKRYKGHLKCEVFGGIPGINNSTHAKYVKIKL
jgi:hypothetical protein